MWFLSYNISVSNISPNARTSRRPACFLDPDVDSETGFQKSNTVQADYLYSQIQHRPSTFQNYSTWTRVSTCVLPLLINIHYFLVNYEKNNNRTLFVKIINI